MRHRPWPSLALRGRWPVAEEGFDDVLGQGHPSTHVGGGFLGRRSSTVGDVVTSASRSRAPGWGWASRASMTSGSRASPSCPTASDTSLWWTVNPARWTSVVVHGFCAAPHRTANVSSSSSSIMTSTGQLERLQDRGGPRAVAPGQGGAGARWSGCKVGVPACRRRRPGCSRLDPGTTQDLDLFTSPGRGVVSTATAALEAVAGQRGWTTRAVQRSENVARLVITGLRGVGSGRALWNVSVRPSVRPCGAQRARRARSGIPAVQVRRTCTARGLVGGSVVVDRATGNGRRIPDVSQCVHLTALRNAGPASGT